MLSTILKVMEGVTDFFAQKKFSKDFVLNKLL